MKNFRYENQGTNTYLVYEISENDAIDSMSLGMLTNNRIPGLAQTSFTQMDMRKFVQYNVTAKVSVSQFFSGAVNKKRLVGVFNGIVNALLSAEEYMIDARSIILNMDYIFTDVSSCETVLVCLPLESSNEELVDMGMFFKGIMFNTQFDQTENSDHVAKIINYLNGTPVFSLYDFKKVLDEIESNNIVHVAQEGKQTQAPIQPVVQQITQQTVQSVISMQEKQSVATSVLDSQKVNEAVVSSQNETKVSVPLVSDMSQIKNVSIKEEKKSIFSSGGKTATPMPMPQKVGGMNIPGGNKKVEQEQSQASTGDKEISWFYLMQHYNKDNAAAYKAQKEAKKEAKKNNSKNGKAKANTKMEMPGQSIQEPNIASQSSELTPTQVALFNNMTTQQPQVQQPVVQQPQVQQAPVQQPYIQPTMRGGFGETTVLNTANIGETTVLSQVHNPMQPVTPFLIRVKTNEKVMLTKPSFRIGKERSFVDYFIADNTAISRCHAQITNNDGTCYVIDMNSTNHTFVNGIMINSNEQVKLSNGDKVRLANEDFEFHLR